MKITFLALHLGFGGVEKYIITIANMLSEKHDVEIISTYKTTDMPSFPVSDQIRIIYLIEGMLPNKEKLKDAINRKNPFKVCKEGFYAFRLLQLKKKRNKEAIQSCDSDIIISTRDFHNEMIQKYAKDDIIKITSEHNHPCGDQKYIDRIINSCKSFDYILPISKELTDFYTKKLSLTKTKVKYIPFCIDKPSCDLSFDLKQPVYINVGRLSKEKGTLELIDIFYKIVQKQPNSLLHLIGDGMLMSQIKEKVKAYKLEKNIVIHGFLHKDKIDELYCASNIYLMTSYTESFGFVLLEAMACGLPCIAFDSAQGAKEIIEDGKNGYLIRNRDMDLYVKKSIELIQNHEKIKQMSLHAKKCIELYSYENTKEKWLDFIEMIKKEHSM